MAGRRTAQLRRATGREEDDQLETSPCSYGYAVAEHVNPRAASASLRIVSGKLLAEHAWFQDISCQACAPAQRY